MTHFIIDRISRRPSSPSRPGPRFITTAALFAAALCLTGRLTAPALAAVTVATWTAGTGDYHNPANWDIGIVPINTETDTYEVVIPGGKTVNMSTDGSFEIDDFSLADSSTLNLGSGSTLTVLDEAVVGGRITASNGHFVATVPGATQIAGSKARFSVANTGTLAIAGQSYSSTGLYNTYDNYYDQGKSWTHDLFVATGAGSVLDLSTIQSINAGFNDNDRDENIHRIMATAEGRIDLSGVKTITAPRRRDSSDTDRLDFVVSTGGEIDLSGVETISSAWYGYTRFDINDADFDLPSLQTASRVNFELDEGATLTMDSLQSHDVGTYTIPSGATVQSATALNLTNVNLAFSNGGSVVMPQLNNFGRSVVTLTPTRTFQTGGLQYINNSRIRVQDSAVWGVVTGDITADAYSSTGLYYTYDNYYDQGKSWTHDLFVATGAGSVLDLSTIQSINAGFNDGDRDENIHRIVATAEGRIDLSGVKTITAPYWYDGSDSDRLDIIVSTGGEIDLSGLETISSARYGYTRFDIDDADLDLPSLQTASRVNFELDEGATLTMDSLQSHDVGTYTIPSGATVQSATALNLTNVNLAFSNGGSVVMPQLNNFGRSVVTLTPTRTFQTGGLQYINNSRIRVQDSAVWGVVTGDITADAYSSTGLYNTYDNYYDQGKSWTHDLFVATGAGSVLDLSTIQSINAGFNDGDRDENIHRIMATAEGRIDLSGVKTITAPRRRDSSDTDRLDFVVSTGGEIDLSGVETISSAWYGYTRFDINDADFDLPSLQTASRVNFELDEGATLTMDSLQSHDVGTYTIPSGATVQSATALNLTNVNLAFSNGGSVVMPQLNNFGRSVVTLTPTRTFQTGGLQYINNSRIRVQDSAVWGVVTGDITADAYSSTGLYNTYDNYYDQGKSWTHDLFVATGAGSVLDLSTIQSINAGFNDNDRDENIHRIMATAEGRIDLSGVKTITAPRRRDSSDTDRLDFVVSTGGEIDLSGVETISSAWYGYTRFDINDADFDLPSLQTASRVNFELDEGATLTMDSLQSHDVGTYTIPSGATVQSATALNLTNVNLAFSNGGSVVMPQLNNFGRSVVTLTPTRTFQTGGLQYINNSRIRVQDSAVWGVVTGDITADAYSSTGLYNTYDNYYDQGKSWTHDLFVATGAGSVLDLSTIQSINAGFNDGDRDENIHRIMATAEGRIDLSGVKTITAPRWYDGYDSDRLDFVVSGENSEIDLSSLRVIDSAGNGHTHFQISTGGRLILGDLVKTHRADFYVNDMASSLRVDGNLNLWSTSTLSVATLASVEVTESLLFSHTNEGSIDIDEAVLCMNGTGLQMLEVGGVDYGVPTEAGGSGNFGIGQLVIGTEETPTTVELVDVFDNGNRGSVFEALYLYGIGVNLDGLILNEGSTLIVDHLNAYAWIDGDWVYLNTWLQDGMAPTTKAIGKTWMKFDPEAQSVTSLGKVVPEPAAIVAVLWGCLVFCTRRSRRERSYRTG